MLKKCPACRSKRIKHDGLKYKCEKCGYILIKDTQLVKNGKT